MKACDYYEGYVHIGLPTGCFDETLKFYGALGFEVKYSTVEGGNRVAFLCTKNLEIETYESAEPAMCDGAINHVALYVNDLDAVRKAVVDAGIGVLAQDITPLPFWDNGVKFFTIVGPNKERVEFTQKL